MLHQMKSCSEKLSSLGNFKTMEEKTTKIYLEDNCENKKWISLLFFWYKKALSSIQVQELPQKLEE